MNKHGSVCGMNPNTGRVVLRTEGGYTVVDIERGVVGPRDILSGRMETPGRATLLNTSRDSSPVSVRIEITNAALDVARALLHEDVDSDPARGCAEGVGTA
jgi:hypothetical protein